MQCKQCWRYGHIAKSCKSVVRCRNCGSAHALVEGSSQDQSCCLWQHAHAADSPSCTVRAQELLVIVRRSQPRCSRQQALNHGKQLPVGYPNAVTREHSMPDGAGTKTIEAVS